MSNTPERINEDEMKRNLETKSEKRGKERKQKLQ